MESCGEEFANNAMAKVVRVALTIRSAKKHAKKAVKEALEVVSQEMKHKGKQIDGRRAKACKQTIKLYF